jgi:predicted enzyme related to lactoylglutathione lyase
MFHVPGFVGGEPTQPVPRDVVAAAVPGEQAAWSVDFWVADVDAAAARTVELGGTVLSPPAGALVGRNTVIADPAGAVLSLSQVVPPASP